MRGGRGVRPSRTDSGGVERSINFAKLEGAKGKDIQISGSDQIIAPLLPLEKGQSMLVDAS